MDSIKAALEAARDEDWRTALDHVLAAWLANPAPEILETFDAVETRAAETTWPIAGDRTSYTDAWLRAVPTADASLLSQLCRASSFEAVSYRSRGRQLAALRQRLHPRVRDLVTRLMKSGPPDSQPYVQVTPRMRTNWALSLDITTAFTAIEQQRPSLAPADAKGCTELRALAKQLTHKRDAYQYELARLIEAGPSLALADYLQQHGDPRGELLALELEAVRGVWMKRVRRRRLEALRAAHSLSAMGLAWPPPAPETLELRTLPAVLQALDTATTDVFRTRVPMALIPEAVSAAQHRTRFRKVVIRTLARSPVSQTFVLRRSRAGELSSLTVQLEDGSSYLITQPIIDLVAALPEDMLQYLRIEQERGAIADGFRDAGLRQIRIRRLWLNGVLT